MTLFSFEQPLLFLSPEQQQQQQPSSRVAVNGRYLLGLCFILLQCLVWIFAAVLTQYLYDGAEDSGLGFHSPFLMTYVGVSMNSVFLLFRWASIRGGYASDLRAPSADSLDRDLQDATNCGGVWQVLQRQTSRLGGPDRSWNHKRHVLAALNLAPPMFLADWAFNGGLAHTSVASST